jgi:hypothetical protein
MSIKTLFLVALLLVTRLDQLNLGVQLDKGQVPKRGKVACAATPSQTYPCVTMKIEDVEFTVGYQEESLRIKYLSTQDKKFRTPDGFQVGTSVTVREDQLVHVPGWKILGPRLESGWRPVFGHILDDDKVLFRDGTVIDLSQPRHGPPRTGELEILELEKGGV